MLLTNFNHGLWDPFFHFVAPDHILSPSLTWFFTCANTVICESVHPPRNPTQFAINHIHPISPRSGMVVFTQTRQLVRLIWRLKMSLSGISDLTDVSSDEDDVPLAKCTSKVKKAPKEYKITGVLRAPRTTQYTAKSLYGTSTRSKVHPNAYYSPPDRPDH